MAGKGPEKGDKVSWNWGSGKPGGTVAEKKTTGEIAIKSKRGNTIKKNASPENPAVHVERSGNDVVKRASELNVEKKASGGQTNGKKRDHAESEDEPTEENAEGKEVKKAPKKQKRAPAKNGDKKAENEETRPAEKEDVKSGAEADDEKETKTEKKKDGRPKKGEGKAKTKKDLTPRSTEGVGSRTRSQK